MVYFSQGKPTYRESPGALLCSELIYMYDVPQDIIRKTLSLVCFIPDVGLLLVYQREKTRSDVWREQAAKRPPCTMTVTECHAQLGFRVTVLGSWSMDYEQHGTSHVK